MLEACGYLVPNLWETFFFGRTGTEGLQENFSNSLLI